MVKATKYLRKQATKAERAANRFQDPEVSAEMRALAEAYRSQAEMMKTKKIAEKKRKTNERGEH